MRVKPIGVKKISLLTFLFGMTFFAFFVITGFSLAEETDLIATEIMYDAEGIDNDKEWIEFKNKSQNSLKIFNWKLIESSKPETQHKISLYWGDSVIEPEEYFIIAENAKEFIKKIPEDYSATVLDSSFSLSNTKEEIILLDADGNLLATTSYENSAGGKGNGFTLEWEDGVWRESFIKGGTPGKKNSQKSNQPEYSDQIKLNEILPNPKDNEKTDEFIELYNFSSDEINLENWILKDASKSGKFVFPKDYFIKPNGYLVVYKNLFKFAMNNSGGEEVFLLNPNEKIVSSVSYEKSFEGISYNFDSENNNWRWSKFLTPGEKNKLDKIPKIEIKKDKKIYKNFYATFEIKIHSKNKKENRVTWDFGDGKKSYKRKTRHKYSKTGTYLVKLKIFTGSEEIVKQFSVKVRKYPHPKVKFIRFSPNPAGKDSEQEWIEIKNYSSKKINLKDWSIKTGVSSQKAVNHSINDDFFLKAGERGVLTRDFSKFSLNNKKGEIKLLYPDGKTADKITYKKENEIKDDEIYEKKNGGKWQWQEKSILAISKPKQETIIKNSPLKPEKFIEVPKEYIGQKSYPKKTNSPILNYGLFAYTEKNPRYSTEFVLGMETKKISAENFLAKTKTAKQEHYLVSFAKQLNKKLNNLLIKISNH